MGWALLFSGQGLQHPDMLPWLARDAQMVALEAELGANWRSRLAAPDDAGDNQRAQVLLTATACAAWAQLQPLIEPPAFIAGYSVGELAAWAAAGVFDADTAMALARQRAALMDDAAAAEATGLLGISGATADRLQALCAQFNLETAIRIDAGSEIVGGRRGDLHGAAALAAARGWRSTPLNVAMASHTRWMRDAAQAFHQRLCGTTLHAPVLPLFSTALGRVRSTDAARTALSRQIAVTVPWDECMEAIAAQQVHAVLEVGPGQALARMWRERHPDVPSRSADEFRSPHAVAAWLRRQLGQAQG